MNTMILVRPGELSAEDREMPRPGPGEAVVNVAYCGICRTDRKCFRLGQRDLCYPRVLGHEFSGYSFQREMYHRRQIG